MGEAFKQKYKKLKYYIFMMAIYTQRLKFFTLTDNQLFARNFWNIHDKNSKLLELSGTQ